MKRLSKIILFILCMFLAGLILLRVSLSKTDVSRQAAAPVPPSSTPRPALVPVLEPLSEPTPEPTPESTPEPTPVPGIVLTEGEEIEWPCGIPFRDPGFTALGKHGEDISTEVIVTGEVTPWHTGDYIMNYALPADAELSEVQRIVHVVPQKMKSAVKPASGTICLTYIDTPCESTAELLKLLKRDDVKATFFISTHQTEFLDLLTQMAADGHELGIYFPDLSWYGGEEGVLEHCLSEIVHMQEIIFEKTGRYAKFIRFYGGTPNAGYLAVRMPGGSEELYRTMHDMGLLVFDWNLEVDVAEVTAKISSNFTHPSEKYDYVVAMQQNFRRQSVLAVPEMIRWGKEKGYTFSTLEDTFPEVLFGQEEYVSVPPSSKPELDITKTETAEKFKDIPEDAAKLAIASIDSAIASIESEFNSLAIDLG